MFDALNAAFCPEEHASAQEQISLPDALWESGPPLAIRDRNGEISFANPAFKTLFDALRSANALSPRPNSAIRCVYLVPWKNIGNPAHCPFATSSVESLQLVHVLYF